MKEVFSVLISQNLFQLLPEEEKKSWEKWQEYTPELMEQRSAIVEDLDGEDYRECQDNIFDDFYQYEDFWGDSWEKVSGWLYKKDFLGIGSDTEQYLGELAEDLEGEQYMICQGFAVGELH